MAIKISNSFPASENEQLRVKSGLAWLGGKVWEMAGQVNENLEHMQFQRVLVPPSLLGHLLIGQGMDGPGLARVSLVSEAVS